MVDFKSNFCESKLKFGSRPSARTQSMAPTAAVVFGSWIFYGLVTASIFVFRSKYPNAERPYRAWGYPIVPVIFLFVTGWLLINTIMTSPESSLIGIGLILLGLPVYFYLNYKGSNGPEDSGNDEEGNAGPTA